MKVYILLLIIYFFYCINSYQIIKEFEAIDIKNNTQILLFNNDYNENIDYYPEIIINCINNNFANKLEPRLVISKTNKTAYYLYKIQTIIISRDNIINEGKGEYKLIIKNYIGGKIVIFNSLNSYPLKDFSELIYMNRTYFNSNFELKFHSNILEENKSIYIFTISNKLKLEKIKENEIQEISLNNNTLFKLEKGYSYNLTCIANQSLGIVIKKREIIFYNNSIDEIKYNHHNLPYYYFVDLNSFDTPIGQLYFFLYHEYNTYIEIANLINDKINENDLDSINYTQKFNLNYMNYHFQLNENFNNSKYILLKFINRYNVNSDYLFNYIHIFHNMITLKESTIINSSKELLINTKTFNSGSYYFLLVISNNTNLKSLESFKTNYFYNKYLDILATTNHYVSLFPSQTPSFIDIYSYTGLKFIYLNEYSIRNFLYPYFERIKQNNIIYFFENNKNSIIYLKKYFGNPKIFFSKKLEDIKNFNYDSNSLELVESQAFIDGPFFLYIYPYENSFIDLLVNEIDNNIIDFSGDDNVLKFLKKNIKYYLENIEEETIRIQIDENLNKGIRIEDSEGNIKNILNKNNAFIDIDQNYNNLIIIPDEDTYIKIYYKIQNLFPQDKIYTIEFEKENFDKGIIINITNINDIKNYHYFTFYGYKDMIPSNIVKMKSEEQYIYLNNPFENIYNSNENIKFYIYLFGNNIEFEINYINTYKLNNSYFDIIKPKDNYYFLPEKNYVDTFKESYSYSYMEIYFCKNNISEQPMKIKVIDSKGKEQIYTLSHNYIYQFQTKTMIQFDYNDEFLLLSYENENLNNSRLIPKYFPYRDPINFYIPQINETTISFLIENYLFNLKAEINNYTIIIVEPKDDENENELLNKLNNSCFIFNIFNDKSIFLDYNHLIVHSISNEDYFLYDEINITSKFSKNKNLYIKILSYSQKLKSIIFSKTKIIYYKNIFQNSHKEEIEEGIINIEENKEYTINNNEYIFKYNLKKNHFNILPIIYLNYYKTYSNNEAKEYGHGELEIINPLLNNFTYNISNIYNFEQIFLSDKNIIKEYGDYYFIFRNCLSIKFYIHNTVNIFSLNKNPNFISIATNSTESIIYFSLKLIKEEFIYFYSLFNIYIYSKNLKKLRTRNEKLPPDEYLLFVKCDPKSMGWNYLEIILKNYLLANEIPFSQLINSFGVDFSTAGINILFDLNSSEAKRYIITRNSNYLSYICVNTKNYSEIDIHSIPFNTYTIEDNHIIDLFNISCPEDNPYILTKFRNTTLEIINDYKLIQIDSNLQISKGNETIAFKLNKTNQYTTYLYFVFSNIENLRDLNKNEIDNTRIIFTDINNYTFKLKQKEDEETELKIRSFKMPNNIEIKYIKENEISDFFFMDFSNNKKTIKYYINLLKKEVIFYHTYFIGEYNIYLLKNELDCDIIEDIMNSDTIDENIFELTKSNNITINPYGILALKYKSKDIIHYFYMSSSLIQDYAIYNPIKYIKRNKKYILKKETIIFFPNNSDANITLSNYNQEENYVLNKDNNIFENFEENLILKSDKDEVIYIAYKNDKNLKLKPTIFKREYLDKVLFFRNNQENIYYNYIIGEKYLLSKNLNTFNFNEKNYIPIYYPYNNIQFSYLTNLELSFYSNYEKSFYDLDNIKMGYNILKANKRYFTQIIHNEEDKKYMYYQYIKCDDSDNYGNEIYLYINEKIKSTISYDLKGFISSNIKTIFFEYFIYNNQILNFCFSNETFINEINENRNFNLYFGSRSRLIVEIIPIYKSVEFNHYIIYTIRKGELLKNPLENICYNKEIIDQEKIEDNAFNFTNKALKGYNYINVTIDINYKIEDNDIIYINILGKDIIFDDFMQLVPYKAKYHKIQEDDFPNAPDIPENEDEDNDNGNNKIYYIIFSIIGFIILGIIIFVCYIKYNKKNKLNNESDIYKENLGEMITHSQL